MKTVYFDFYGKPAKILLDEGETPDVCEVYNPETGDFEKRDDLTLDVMDSHGSNLINEADFLVLLEKVQDVAGKIE